MPEIRIDRIIRRLIISRTSMIEDIEEETRFAIVVTEDVKTATIEKSAYTNENTKERALAPKASSKFVCVVAVDKVYYWLFESLQKT